MPPRGSRRLVLTTVRPASFRCWSHIPLTVSTDDLKRPGVENVCMPSLEEAVEHPVATLRKSYAGMAVSRFAQSDHDDLGVLADSVDIE